MNKILIKNCRIYDDLSSPKDILVEDNVIKQTGTALKAEGAFIYDAGEKIACPGFIDVHIQGAGGADILDGTPGALQKMSETLAKLGTTSFLGTTVVKPEENNRHIRTANNYVNKDLNGAHLLGYHLEGPFINPNKKGGLDPDAIYPSSKEKLAEILDLTVGHLRMMTIAPEMPGNLELISILRQKNVVASFAHSEADYYQVKEGIKAGINHVTHIFNAMLPINHRSPGPIAAIFEDQDISAQIISDGHHLHPAIVKMIYRNIGPERCICITDGVQAMGLPEGRYVYNGRDYESKDGAARYLDGTLIGSANCLAQVTIKFMHFTGCTLKEAINTASLNPARLLGIDNKKGQIKEKHDADIVLLDKDYSVSTVLVNGKFF